MTALLLLMACSVLAGIPAALLVFATDVRLRGNDDDEDDDHDGSGWGTAYRDSRTARLLRSQATQAELYAYMVGEVEP